MTEHPWVRGLLSVVLMVGGSSFTRGAEAPRAEWAAEELRARLGEAQRRIRSVYIEYRSQRGAYREPDYPAGTYLHRIVAVKAPCFFYQVSTHGHDRLDWQQDPLQQRCRVTAQHWCVANPVQRTYWEGSLQLDDPLPGTMPQEFFFWATGLWPLDQRPPPRIEGQPYMLREIAACRDYGMVGTRQELVDGHWCHVLERPGIDRLWVDCQRGFTVLARETHSPTHRTLVQRVELGGHRELAPEVWMPAWMRNVQYDYQARTEEGRRRKVIDALHDVLDIQVNQVEDSLFAYEPPPGALKLLAFSQPPVQTEPGGLDHLDHLVGWIQARPPSRPSSVSVWPGYFAGLPFLIAILAAEAWRRRPRRLTGCLEHHAEEEARGTAMPTRT